MSAGPEILHVGSACRDVAPEAERGWRLGGGVTYAALTTARLGLRTAAVVGVDDEARTAFELDLLRDAGVDLMLVRLSAGPIYHNREAATGRVQTCVQRGGPLPIPTLPESWGAAPGWSIAPVAAEIGDEWAAIIPDEAFVGIAWQGLLRHLVDGQRVTRLPPSPSPLIRRGDLVGVSHHDVDPATPLSTLFDLLKPGAALLITQGDEGGLLATLGVDGPTEVLRYLPTRTDGEIDPTGAGDTFLAALLATVVRPSIAVPSRRPRLDLRFAAAAGSLVVEGPGLAGVPDRPAVVRRRVRERVRRAIFPTEASQVGSYPSTADEARTPGDRAATPGEGD
ncbi:MAG: PfkB family carbohydrate kinase [Chloroflexota bacterium]